MKEQLISNMESCQIIDKHTANTLRSIKKECGDNAVKSQLMLTILQLEGLFSRDLAQFKGQILTMINLSKVLVHQLPNN